MQLASFARQLGRLLEGVVIVLMISLTALVVTAVIYRKLGASLSWYDEVASIMLAWLTYYGAALAALRRAHIGFDGLLFSLPERTRMLVAALAEAAVFAFFAILAWMGWRVLQVLSGVSLISLTWVPVQVTQSVIPIGAVLFMIAEALSLPAYWERLRAGISEEHVDLSGFVENDEALNGGDRK
jgi:TRAP-type C4-dicarboxylate transport system permease small subunit